MALVVMLVDALAIALTAYVFSQQDPALAWLAGIAGAMAVVLTPVSVLLVVLWWREGEMPEVSLEPFYPSRARRALRRSILERPPLDDEAFYDRYYARTNVPRWVSDRLRRMLVGVISLPVDRLRPEDDLIAIDGEPDAGEVLLELKDYFPVTCVGWPKCDALTFDCVVRGVSEELSRAPNVLGVTVSGE